MKHNPIFCNNRMRINSNQVFCLITSYVIIFIYIINKNLLIILTHYFIKCPFNIDILVKFLFN